MAKLKQEKRAVQAMPVRSALRAGLTLVHGPVASDGDYAGAVRQDKRQIQAFRAR